MKAVFQTSQFKKDLKRLKKRRKDLPKLMEMILAISTGQPLGEKFRDHALTGNWAGSRECHKEPDWILIYRLEDGFLFLERSGMHSDLFR